MILMNVSPYGRGCFGNTTDTTQQSGRTPDKEAENNNVAVYVSGYTETEETGVLSPKNSCLAQQSVQTPAAVHKEIEYWCNGQNVSDRTCYRCAASLGPKRTKDHNRCLKPKFWNEIQKKLNFKYWNNDANELQC